MGDFFPRLKVGVLNDHYDIIGGGTAHSFKFIEYLKRYYDVEVNVPGNPKPKEWMENFLHLNTNDLTILPYTKNCGNKYDYMFLNISHWRAEPTRALKKFMLVFFPQFYFPLYDYHFLANSEYTKENIISRWKQLDSKVDVVFPPVITHEYKAGVKEGKNILHVSRISPPVPECDKGHRQMIQAFKEMVDNGLTGWNLHLVGQVQDQNYFQEIFNLANGYPIFFHIGIPFAELKGLYSKADIYWHMTGITMPQQAGAQEHFGMTTVEAMASGAVPVVLGTGGQLEIVENEKNGILVNNEQELKEKTLYLIKNKVVREKMSKEAIKRSRVFDEKEVKKKFYSVTTHTDKVTIIILCWNNSQYTKDCVNRLYEVTPEGFELILVDNNSTDDTEKVCHDLQVKYPNIKYIHNPKNVGFAKGNNIALEHARGEYICFLNNDTIPQWGWLERMVDILETNEKVGIVGARLYYNEEKGIWKIQHAGVRFVNGEPQHIGRFQEDKDVRGIGYEEVEAVTGACMLVRKKFARFNESYVRGYYEDTQMCLDTREKGYKVVISHEARMIHFEGKSQDILKKEDKTKFDKISEANKDLFNTIWSKERMSQLPKISDVPDLTGTNYTEKVEIGGGSNPTHPDYEQVDLNKMPHIRYNNDARILPFPSNTVKDICSTYMLNCLSLEEAEQALKEWFRCLKPGGRLELYVPDLKRVSKEFIATNNEELLKQVYGKTDSELNMYKWGYSIESLDRLLSKVNFVRVTYLKPLLSHPYSMGLEAFKPL